jgi:hypothetical protein
MASTAATFTVTVVHVVTVTDFGELLDPGNSGGTASGRGRRSTGNSGPTLQESSQPETK